MDLNEFRKHGHVFVDWIADYLENIEQYPVKSTCNPGDIIGQIADSPPSEGESMEAIFEDFKKTILPGISHWQHPGWFAYFSANNSPASILAEMLTAGMGVQGMIWETSPAATELEEAVMNWLRKMIGLPESFSGVIQDTASSAGIVALLTAREKKTDFDINQKGFHQKLRVYTSTQAHSSIEKGVKIVGIGKENLVYIDVDEKFAMKPAVLAKAIQKDIEDGYTPCCVVATLGTTSSMAMDPLSQIAQVCNEYKLWLHVDAAFAGTAAIMPELRSFMDGAELADSFVFNPHKWMLTNFDCSAYFIRDAEALKRTLTIMPEYLKTGIDSQVNNYRDWGIPLGRRFRALKLWFVVRNYGVEGIRAMVKKHVSMAKEFASWIEADPGFELLAPVNLSLVCFRRVVTKKSEIALNAMNKSLLANLNATGEVYLTHTVLNGKYCIRLAIGQQSSEKKHINKVWELLRKKANKTDGAF